MNGMIYVTLWKNFWKGHLPEILTYQDTNTYNMKANGNVQIKKREVNIKCIIKKQILIHLGWSLSCSQLPT
jgi:hypothetical protein